MVVKLLRVSRSSYHKEIMNEICMHEALCQHPRVVGYFGCFHREPDRFGLVLESYDMSLQDWLEKAPADMASRVKASSHLLEAVRFLHTLGGGGVIHRDIKPANLLVNCEPRGLAIVKCALTDFGFTCVPGRLLFTSFTSVHSPCHFHVNMSVQLFLLICALQQGLTMARLARWHT